ncbi:Ig-like domain-containing protein [Chiayiivirga flava]|uniref:Pimeloyl-ACP methyl ester carboxylesterase n=1 Tax=Chiayiivirga flava TaxID=659595 RepID=A0A7W8FYX6_9GAMM|nr:lipase [Chiayiivirga flava]MBB5207591.1 pimeloyl-ACP methyl ester carboxylesterase [Chiayiivirga flava]
MQARLSLTLALSSLLLAACGGSSNSDRAAPTPPAENNNGSPVNGVLTARFDPTTSTIPLPNNLLLSGTTDLTLNPPVANPNNFSDPTVAISTLDGWSTTAPWSTAFNARPDPASLLPGQSIRVFEVSLTGPGGGVTGIVRELAGGTEFVAALAPSDATGRTLAIVPTAPLKQLTSYLVVLTDRIRDANGNDATPDQTYFLSKRPTPLCVNGVSQEPLLPNATACSLEPLRQLTNSQLAAAGSAGIARDDVVVSWVFTTQSITPVLQAVRSITQPGATLLANSGQTIAVANLPPIADIYIGTITLPYYLTAPSAENPTGPLTGFWKAAPGAYVAPFNGLGLNPTSTNITFANPIPVATTNVTVPVVMTVPNAASGRTMPASGWPIVIYQHGITRSRLDALAISGTAAAQGFAVVAIDLPLHGLLPGEFTSPFYNERTPFADIAQERTFDVDYVDNDTGAPGPDGRVDTSGAHFINLSSLLTSRDNLRQGIADLFVLTASIPSMDIDGNGTGDFDSSRIEFVGQSLGAIAGTSFLALEPNVNTGVLSVPGGGIARMLDASPTFGPRIRAGLAAAGVQAGTPDYDRFMVATQQVIDSADPVNYGFASAQNAILLHEVVGDGAGVLPDQVIPNSVAGAPLSGTEPLIRALGLTPIDATVEDPDGIRGVTRFIEGDHGSLLSPAASLAATIEMQGEMASFLVSDGAAVVVSDPSVIRTQ